MVDTNLANFLSYKKAILSITNSEYSLIHDLDKRFNRKTLIKAIPNLSECEYERIIQEKEEYFKDYLQETKLYKPVVDILCKYSKTNQTILVTNCRQDRASETLNYHGLTDKFSKLFFRQFSVDGKIVNKFQNAISELAVSPNLVIVFENEEKEIADAKIADIQIINPIIV